MRVKGFTEVAKKNRKSAVHHVHDEQQAGNCTPDNILESQSDFMNGLDDDSSSVNSNSNCNHLPKSINNLSTLKKMLKQQSLGECSSCLDLKRKGNNNIQIKKDANLWVCLACGHQGCDRSSEYQHALKHYKIAHSMLHCIVFNIEKSELWCYECDTAVSGYGKRVEEVINLVKKSFSQLAQNNAKISVKSNIINEHSSSESINQIDTQQAAAIAIINRNNQIIYNRKQQQQQQQQQQQVVIQNTTTNHGNSSNSTRVIGLSNLGNTCFFNAVLQNLAQTPNLENVLLEALNSNKKQEIVRITPTDDIDNTCSDLSDNDENDNEKSRAVGKRSNNIRCMNKNDNLDISINEAGVMTVNLHGIIKEMNSVARTSTLSPNALFSLVCKKVPSFKGFQQQDSHELLRHLLDAIKAEEIKRRQYGILSACNPSKQDLKHLDDATKQRIKAFGRTINYTCIDSLFGGHLLSTILCEQCKTCSQNIEPFLDLSLSIVDEKSVNYILTQNKMQNISRADDVNDDDDNHVSKHKLKKQKKLAKKNKKNVRVKPVKQQTDEEVPTLNKQTNLDNTVSDDEQDEAANEQEETAHDINNNNTDNNTNVENDDNEETSKIDDIASSLNNALDYSHNSFKLEAMQSLGKRTLVASSDDDSSCSLQSFLLKFTSPELLTGNNKFGCESCTRSHYRKLNSNANSMPKEMKTVYTQATKQYLICELPAVLTIHLKRFQQQGFRLEKVNKHVNFPLELDVAPFTSKMCTNLQSSNNGKVLYSLYGVVEHSGRLNGGHYTAYVKARQRQNLEKYLGKKRQTVLKPPSNLASLSSSNNNLPNSDNISSSSGDSGYSSESTNSSSWYYISDSHVAEVPESKILKLQAYILFYERVIQN